MLKMKSECEKCKASLDHKAEAFICSYECTFCPDCTAEMKNVCPNCSGELVRRPRRDRGPAAVVGSQVRRGIGRMLGKK